MSQCDYMTECYCPQIQMFKAQYATLSHLPLSKPYPTHQRRIELLMAKVRSKRQEEVIYDCELTEWYKFLVKAVGIYVVCLTLCIYVCILYVGTYAC